MLNLIWLLPSAFAIGFYIGHLLFLVRRAQRGRDRAERDALALCVQNEELRLQNRRMAHRLEQMTAYQTNAVRNAPLN